MTSEGKDMRIEKLSCQLDSSATENERSQIADFFAHNNILITGGTGFIGKLLIEKLLRSCPDITNVYMIVRPKKGKSPGERFKATFEDVIFSKLREEQPDFTKKVIMIEGDATQEDYGLSAESKQILMNTNIIFHAAATVRFDEKLRSTMYINVKSTKYLVLFAKKLPNLKAFVHVSTAFSFCNKPVIEEVHYQPIIDGDDLMTLLDILDDEKIEKITPVLLENLPNTYVFTKSIAEGILLKYGDDLPLCIVRPSIVLSTCREPIVGWINNLYGATGVATGACVGLLHTLHCVPENIADIIPADFVIANIIAAAWDVNERRSKILEISNAPDEERIPVYNSVSCCQNPISWGEYMYGCETNGFKLPTMNIYWYYHLTLNRYLFVHNIYVLLFHLIPAAIVDAIALLMGKKPMLLNIYKKIGKFSDVISFFCTNQWQFRNDNVMKIWEKCNSRDREIFNVNVGTLDWEQYFYGYMKGIRTYLLNDPIDTLEQAKRKAKRLYILHYFILTLFSLLFLWITVSLSSYLWCLCPLAH